ncbi:MAG: 50S ribosomal protein L7/L12 [Fibromonadaceae bacterium]|jgi:large subunit ribosomal protein L7/L12|nr:50S ribosomal protein L7/L12 [Fibromonadaceae bacterium]
MATDVKTLGDQIVALTLLEAKALADYLKETHGLEAAAGGAVVMAAPAGGGAAAPAAEEKTEFDVVLVDGGAQKLNVIKVLRAAVSGLGLKEAKDLVDKGNATIKEAVAKAEAEKLKKELEDAGAKVTLK